MSSKLRILHLEDDANDKELVHSILEDGGLPSELIAVESLSDFLLNLDQGEFDVILADYRLPKFDGISALKIAQAKCSHVPFIFVSGTLGEELAIETLKNGATDYVLKQRLNRLVPAVLRALKEAEKRSDVSKAESALREAESKFRTLVEKVPAIVYIAEFGSAGKWRYVSPQVELILGFQPEEFLSDPGLWYRQLHEADREQALDDEELSYESGQQLISEYRMYSKDRRIVWFRDEGVVMEGSPAFIQGVMLDITDLKQAEDARIKLEQQLRQAQKIEAIGQLAGGVAHDFNNLLMAISGYCELLMLKLSEQDPARNDVVEIRKAAEQGASLTGQLLAFSRKQILQPKILDANQILSNMDGMLRRLIREDIELCTMAGNNLGKVKADPGQIEQVIINLAVNARDAMPDGGKLIIETTNAELDRDYAGQHVSVIPGQYVVLAVSDSGSGMDEDTKSRIFEPFFTTKEEGKGTGLGLSTVYGIVKQSGGYIWVYSEVGRGTTFKIYLPRVDEVQAHDSKPDKVESSRSGSETILLVDDNDSVRTAVAYLLQVRGYTVLQADDGPTALDLAAKHPGNLHLMITDMVMPHMSGLELAKNLEVSRPDMKIIFMSGYTEEAVNRHGILDPSLTFLQKPTSMDVLLRKIREVMESK